MRERSCRKRFFLSALGAAPFVLLGFVDGPPPANTGAPGETTCWQADCHFTSSGELFENSGAISVRFPNGMTYQPGLTQRLELTVTDAAGVVFGFQASARDAQNGQAGDFFPNTATVTVLNQGSVQYIEHTLPNPAGKFSFDWMPPAQDVGPVTLYVAANAANNNIGRSGDRIHLRSFQLTPTQGVPIPTIVAAGVKHGATFAESGPVADNMFGSIFGTNLVTETANWGSSFVNGVAPTELGGARVTVNNKPAFISFTGRAADLGGQTDQINFVYPDQNGAEGTARVVVETANGISNSFFVDMVRSSPGFFAFDPQGRRYVAALQNDFSAFVGPEDLFGGPTNPPMRPAKPDDIVALFGSGFGPTDPAVSAGKLTAGGERTLSTVTVRVGGVNADVLFAGLSSNAGVYQIVIRIPNLPDGDHELVAEVDGRQTQAALFVNIAE